MLMCECLVAIDIYLEFVLEKPLKPGDRCDRKHDFCGNHFTCDNCMNNPTTSICMSGNHNVQLYINCLAYCSCVRETLNT